MSGIELDFTKDYYKALGLTSTASPEDIKKRHKDLAGQYHPDVNKNTGAEEKFREVQTAFEILGDEDRRRKYDEYRMAAAKQAALEKNNSGPLGADLFEALFNRTISLDDFIARLSRRGTQPSNKGPSPGAQAPSAQGEDSKQETVVEELARVRQELARRKQELQDRIDKMRAQAKAAAPPRPANAPPTEPTTRYPFDFSTADSAPTLAPPAPEEPVPLPGPLYNDDTFAGAAGLIAETGQASTAMLQHRLGIEYTAATAIIDEMEQRGWVGPLEGPKPREILDLGALSAAAKLSPDSVPLDDEVLEPPPDETPSPNAPPASNADEIEKFFGIDAETFGIIITEGKDGGKLKALSGDARPLIQDALMPLDEEEAKQPLWQLKGMLQDPDFRDQYGFQDTLHIENIGIHGGASHNLDLHRKIYEASYTSDQRGFVVVLRNQDRVIFTKDCLIAVQGTDDGLGLLVAGARAKGWDSYHIDAKGDAKKLLKTARAFAVNGLELDQDTQTRIMAAMSAMRPAGVAALKDWETAKCMLIKTVPKASVPAGVGPGCGVPPMPVP